MSHRGVGQQGPMSRPFAHGSPLILQTPRTIVGPAARFLARQIVKSAWGQQRGLDGMDNDDESIHRFARMIAMPVDLVMEINAESRTPQLISLHFEVPEEDARLRLGELAAYAR